MAKTWANYECRFNTTNTANALPDSDYFVTADLMIRVAYVNLDPGRRALTQTTLRPPTVCYLKEGGDLIKAIMKQGRDEKITVESVAGDIITIKVVDSPKAGQQVNGTAFRIPINGYCTFDFTNADGVLSHVHVGHAVKNLIAGAPSKQEIALALSRLEDAKALLDNKMPMASIRDMITR